MTTASIFQFSTAIMNGTLTAICYIKRPGKKYRMYKLTRSTARRIKMLKNIIICK